jgi:hypothetical protein
LEPPYSLEEAKRAFRRLAFKTHPDRPGGSRADFLQAQASLREAIAAIERGDPGVIAARSATRTGSRTYVPPWDHSSDHAICSYA